MQEKLNDLNPELVIDQTREYLKSIADDEDRNSSDGLSLSEPGFDRLITFDDREEERDTIIGPLMNGITNAAIVSFAMECVQDRKCEDWAEYGILTKAKKLSRRSDQIITVLLYTFKKHIDLTMSPEFRKGKKDDLFNESGEKADLAETESCELIDDAMAFMQDIGIPVEDAAAYIKPSMYETLMNIAEHYMQILLCLDKFRCFNCKGYSHYIDSLGYYKACVLREMSRHADRVLEELTMHVYNVCVAIEPVVKKDRTQKKTDEECKPLYEVANQALDTIREANGLLENMVSALGGDDGVCNYAKDEKSE